MGIFDKLKGQGRHKAKAKDMSDAAERRANEKTGGKYEDQIDAAQQRTEGALGLDRDRERPDQP